MNIRYNPGVELHFLEATANGTNYVGIRGPSSIATSILLVLPADNGLGALSNDGAGNLTWGTGSGGGQIVSTWATTLPWLVNIAATTNPKWSEWSNDGGHFYFGIESAAGSNLLTAGTPYSTILGTVNATSLLFGTNQITRVTIDASGDVTMTKSLTLGGGITLPKTIMAGGATGAQTIDKPTGRVNFAAGATSLVVTNSLVTANSVITVTKATNDATARLGAAVAGAGSFTIFMDVGPAAECAVNFRVTN